LSAPFEYDLLEIVNGPEDGTQFPITRSPVDIGSSPDASVIVRFDRNVGAKHVRVSVVSDGYRVRRLESGSISVDGKRVGRVHSRIVRDGGTVKVGETEFFLRCAPAGLAGRSHGIPLESDFTWMVRLLWQWVRPAARACGRFCVRILRQLWLPVLLFTILFGLIAAYRPSLFQTAARILAYGWNFLRYFAQWATQLLGG